MEPIGLYLHIPFCDGKCAYCNFFSKRADTRTLSEYTEALIASVVLWGKKINRPVDTVYFGGGTPSLLGHERLIAILNAVKSAFALTDSPEITVEVNPTSTDELDFSAMRNAGFNRLSIGLQSAVDNELCILGRRHNSADALRTVQRAQSVGFDNISLDVMLAIPEQTIDSLDKTLKFCAFCGVQHISAYILKIEEGTRFYRLKDRLPLLTDDEQAVFYEHAVKKLSDLGYSQYEISNFAHKGFESRHNLHYWRDEEYLGLGPSAHSYLDGTRFYYDNDFQNFYEDHTVFESNGGDCEEYLMLALRLSEGLNFGKYQERFHQPISPSFLKAARRLADQDLCRLTDQGVSLTVKGFLVSNAVIAYLSENT